MIKRPTPEAYIELFRQALFGLDDVREQIRDIFVSPALVTFRDRF